MFYVPKSPHYVLLPLAKYVARSYNTNRGITMKLGYSEFIDKHKTLFLSLFLGYIVIYFLVPIIYLDTTGYTYDNRPFTIFNLSPIMLCVRGLTSYSTLYYNAVGPYTSFEKYYATTIKYYFDGIMTTIFSILIIASVLFIFIRYLKRKSITHLIFIPFCIMIISNIICIICAVHGILRYAILDDNIQLIPINLIVSILFSIPVFLYCFKFQRFGKPRPHKPTDKERIAELERQVAELQKEREEISL